MITIYSPNMIKTYTNCPKKYYYQYIEHLNIPKSSSPFEKGKKIHALANYRLKGTDITRIETSLSSEEQELWLLLQSNPFFCKDYLKSEFSLSISLENSSEKYWIGGRIDAIVADDEDEYYILDYKTGKTPLNPEFDPQTMVYLLCVDKYLKNYNKLNFVYINLKEKNNYVIDFNQNFKKQYERTLFAICQKISNDNIYFETNSSCQYCEFKKLCKMQVSN